MNQTILEIRSQYEALRKTLSLFEEKRASLARIWAEKKPKALAFIGCGSSYMVSCSLRDAAAKVLDLPVFAMAAGDLWLNCESYQRQLDGAMIVAVSRSGKTSEILHAADAMDAAGIRYTLCGIVAATDTPLGERAAVSLEIPWAFDESVCQTRSVSNLYAAGLCLISGFAGDKKVPESLSKLCETGDAYLKKAEPLREQIAKEPWDKAVVLATASVPEWLPRAPLRSRRSLSCRVRSTMCWMCGTGPSCW